MLKGFQEGVLQSVLGFLRAAENTDQATVNSSPVFSYQLFKRIRFSVLNASDDFKVRIFKVDPVVRHKIARQLRFNCLTLRSDWRIQIFQRESYSRFEIRFSA